MKMSNPYFKFNSANFRTTIFSTSWAAVGSYTKSYLSPSISIFGLSSYCAYQSR